MAKWYIYDTHGDPYFKKERLDFDSWDDMIEHINNNPELKERIETNWAVMHAGSYQDYQINQAYLLLMVAIEKLMSNTVNTEERSKDKICNLGYDMLK